MIPKVIHYCWFSEEKKPRLIRKCMKSWKRVMPEYEIRCWDGKALRQLIADGTAPAFVSEALAARKWAFAADWLRLYILYTCGGIYLDSDILVYKSFDKFLTHAFFTGTEKFDEGRGYEVEAGIMGAQPGLPMLKKAVDYFNDKQLLDASGHLAVPTLPVILADIYAELGYVREYKDQIFSTADGEYAFYAEHTFINNIDLRIRRDKGYCARHCNALSWNMQTSALLKTRRFILLNMPGVFWSLQRLRSYVRKDYRWKNKE